MIKIAVIIPIAYRGGSLRGAIALINSLIHGALALNDSLSIVFGYIDSPDYNDAMFADLHASVQRRPYQWQTLDNNEAFRAMHYAGHLEWEPKEEAYSYPDDGINQFLDCSLWLIISDRLNKALLPIRPHILMVYDYIQRYLPFMSMDYEQQFIANAHRALCLLTTTEFTRQDVLQYVGLAPENVVKMPVLAPNFECVPVMASSHYFVWATNSSPHKNHLNTFEALKHYYDEHHGTLECHITGVDTEQLGDYYPLLSQMLKRSPTMKKMMVFCGELSDADYKLKLKHAAFFLHTALIDNGTLAVIEAAQMGVPSLSNDYACMREIDKQFDLNLAWMDATSSQDMANHLMDISGRYLSLKENLMAKNKQQFTHTNDDNINYWTVVKSCL